MKLLKEIRDGLAAQLLRVEELDHLITFEQQQREEGEKADAPTPSDEAPPLCRAERKFVISSPFLREASDYLMQVEEETLAYVSGIELGDTVVLDQLIAFNMDVQETGYVSGEIISTTAVLDALSKRGFVLQGTIHSHPGGGAAATCPSGIDKNHHRRLEVGGYKALGIIMTRDGHVRFYTHKMSFTVDVVGRDVDQIDDHVFKLHAVDPTYESAEQVPASRQKRK